MSAITAANERQFIATIAPCIPSLRRYAVRLTRNHADADDLIQDTLLRAVRKLNLWQPGSNMMAWLVVMMRRLYLSKVTTVQSRAIMISIDDWDVGTPPTQLGTIELRQVSARWAALSKEHQDILTIVVVEGDSYVEAAQRLQIPTGTVRSRLSRARGYLRDEMQTQQ